MKLSFYGEEGTFGLSSLFVKYIRAVAEKNYLPFLMQKRV
jgi:hypothetical protein